ncbi:MAG TPA: hypothetical protein VMV94_06740 [Phycisphaerae bacterium]|nr:hypothetical protein [Phycisphaerae bacterium]
MPPDAAEPDLKPPASAQAPELISSAGKRESDWHVVACFILLLAGLYLTIGPALKLSGWHIRTELNPAFLEAQAWRDGRMDLSWRAPDTALCNGKVYSVHPPLFTLLSLAALRLGSLYGLPADQFYTPWYVIVVALPLPLVGFWAFQQVLHRAAWSAVLTAYWLIGTPMLPQLILCGGGSINPLNLILGSAGLMLVVGDLLGRRRMWPTAIGLVIALWSRPDLVFFGLAALWIAWRMKDKRRRSMILIGCGLTVAVGTLMVLNWLKFGSPFESGYRYVYDYRPNSWLGHRALTYGVFSPHFLRENAYSMNLAPPHLRLTSGGLVPENEDFGVGIWFTSPLLLGAFIGLRRWLPDRPARALMFSSLLVIAALLMYHATGGEKVGYYRFALDWLPVWLMALAPWAIERWRRYFTLGCLAWSGLYFNILWQAYP